MKIDPEDPRLTAHLLGELDAAENALITDAIAADPALQTAIAELNLASTDLHEALTISPTLALLPAQRAAILENARQADRPGKFTSIPQAPRYLKWCAIPLAAAAVIAIVVSLNSQPATPSPPAVAVNPSEPSQALPQPQIQPKPATPKSEIAISPRSDISLTVAERPALILPILSGPHSLARITQAIRTERQLPAPASVQLEEMLNSFPLKLNATTAIARRPKGKWHPDMRQEGITSYSATLGAETLPCPWKPSATLLLISLRGNPTDASQAMLVFHPNAENVSRYRLLGFTAAQADSKSQTSSNLAADSTTTLAIEIESSNASEDLGTLAWTINDLPAPPLTIKRNPAAEPSDDARFAALICAYAKWLSREDAAVLDRDLLSALARENAAENLPPERADFLVLIEQSLNL